MTMKKLQQHYDKDNYGGDVDDVDDDTKIGPVLGILYPGQSPIAPASCLSSIPFAWKRCTWLFISVTIRKV